MAIRMVSTLPAASDTPAQDAGPLFKAFEWSEVSDETLLPARKVGEFAGKVQDVALGIATILRVLERDSLDEGCDDDRGQPIRKIFDIVHASNLERLSITALQMLGEEAARHVDWVEHHAKPPHGKLS